MKKFETFDEYFEPENFPELDQLCKKYASIIGELKADHQPILNTVIAARLFLAIDEYQMLVEYFNGSYQAEMALRVEQSLQQGEILNPDESREFMSENFDF